MPLKKGRSSFITKLRNENGLIVWLILIPKLVITVFITTHKGVETDIKFIEVIDVFQNFFTTIDMLVS